MSKFREWFSHIRLQCDSAAFRSDIRHLRDQFHGSPLVLYGAGDLGARTAKWLVRCGIHPDCFCDRSKTGIHRDTSLPIVSPKDLLPHYKGANILICSIAHAHEIRQNLLLSGISEDCIYFVENLPIRAMTVEDFLPYVDGYEWAYQFFADDMSKAIICSRVEGYLLSAPLRPSQGVEYFDDSAGIALGSEEVFVDGGMFDGDTAMAFVHQTKGKFRHYYGFEIDDANYGKAAQNLAGIERMTLVQKGLWRSEMEHHYHTNLLASSKLSESGDGIIQVTSLDKFFADTPDQPTLIKMDIEGAEKEALLGAENVIKSVRPKLAICAYHKPEDIYCLPQLLESYEVGYRFALRHYSDNLLDTVLYAV